VARGGTDPLAALRGQGIGYVQYALAHPGRFRLMFRDGVLHPERTLHQHADAAFEELATGVRRAAGVEKAEQMTAAHWNAVITLWSLVHGYAHLAIAGRFGAFVAMAGEGQLPDFVQATLPAALDAALAGLFPARRR
jgi:hypothetical protein